MESLVPAEHRVYKINGARSIAAAWVWLGVLVGIPENRTHPPQKLLSGVFASVQAILERWG